MTATRLLKTLGWLRITLSIDQRVVQEARQNRSLARPRISVAYILDDARDIGEPVPAVFSLRRLSFTVARDFYPYDADTLEQIAVRPFHLVSFAREQCDAAVQ